MYNPEDDIVPPELLAQALAISSSVNLYKVYFDKDNGDILSITNEENPNYFSYIEVEYDVVRDFFINKKKSNDYKVAYVDQQTPKLISKFEGDVNLVNLHKVQQVNNWDCQFTVENYPLKNQWGFQLRPDQREILKKHNLNTTFEIFVVDKNNYNFIYRSIKIMLKDVIDNDRIYIPYLNQNEKNIDKTNIFVKRFFTSVGYQVLYDTES